MKKNRNSNKAKNTRRNRVQSKSRNNTFASVLGSIFFIGAGAAIGGIVDSFTKYDINDVKNDGNLLKKYAIPAAKVISGTFIATKGAINGKDPLACLGVGIATKGVLQIIGATAPNLKIGEINYPGHGSPYLIAGAETPVHGDPYTINGWLDNVNGMNNMENYYDGMWGAKNYAVEDNNL